MNGCAQPRRTNAPKTGEGGRCLLCGSSQSQVLAKICRYRIPRDNVICKNCGLVYIPKSETQSLAMYDDGSYRKQYKVHDLDGTEYRMMKRRKARGLLAHVPEGGRVLDIGCANAILLHEIRGLKRCAVAGIEPDRALAEKARKDFNIEVFPGTLDDYRGAAGFDFIILDHVLEHFDDPLAALGAVRRLLSPAGCVYIEVPDIRAPYGDLDLNFFQHAHLFSFSAKTLRMMLRLAGLKVDGHYGDGTCISLIASAGDIVSREEIDFDTEGEDWREMAKYLTLYKYHYRAGNTGRAGNRAAFYKMINDVDIELARKMVDMRLSALRDECLMGIDEGNYGGAMHCINEYCRILGVKPREAVEMLALGKLLADKRNDPESAGLFMTWMGRIHGIVEQVIGGGADENHRSK